MNFLQAVIDRRQLFVFAGLVWIALGHSVGVGEEQPVEPTAAEPSLAAVAGGATAAPNQLADSTRTQALLPTLANGEQAPVVAVSVAEQITRLEKAIVVDEQRLKKLREEIAAPMSEYRLAESSYKTLEDEFVTATANLATIQQETPENVVAAQAMLDDLGKKRDLARERFDLAIQTRKTLQEQINAVEAKQVQDREALEKLRGDAYVAAPIANVTTPSQRTLSAVVEPPAGSPATAEPAAPVAGGEIIGNVTSSLTPAPVKAPSKELVKAQTDADLKKSEALRAEEDVQSVAGRIEALDKDIALEDRLLVATRKKADLAYQSAQELEAEKDKRLKAGESAEELQAIRQQRREAEQLFKSARAEVAERVDRLNELQNQRAGLQREELAAVLAAKEKLQEAEEAVARVTKLKNPFSAHNLLQWSLDHGPKLGAIVIAMLVLRWMVSLASMRIVRLMTMRSARGTRQEREDRARTLVGVFQNAVAITIVVSGVLMICEEVGIAVGPLMGGAAVIGLAVAFGAQNLIRDYFYGFVILLENQYKLNDVLRIGDASGQVEQITLRMTVLRDQEGNVHFIPNGKIDSVTNMTHGWSRAVVNVPIGYGEDADRVMELLLEIARELRNEQVFQQQILGEPEMLGVDSLGDSAVTLKLLVKTRALSQWAVKRELLRRIKRRFDELGIEFPYPQQVVHYRQETGAAPTLDLTNVEKERRKKVA